VVSSKYLLILSNILAGNCLTLICSSIKSETSFCSTIPNAIYLFASNLAAIMLFYVFIRHFGKIKLEIPTKYLIVMNLVVINFFIIFNFFISINNTLLHGSAVAIIYTLKITVCFLLLSFFVIYLFGEISLFYQKERERYKIELKNKVLEQQLIIQEATAENMKRIRHDIKNNLTNIAYLLKENYVQQSVEYIEAITSAIEKTKPLVNCGNT